MTPRMKFALTGGMSYAGIVAACVTVALRLSHPQWNHWRAIGWGVVAGCVTGIAVRFYVEWLEARRARELQKSCEWFDRQVNRRNY